MKKNFETREYCPVCKSKKQKLLLSTPHQGKKIWPFLERYYKGKVPKEKVDFDFTIVKCQNCSLLFQKNILNEKEMFSLYEEWISPEESLKKKEEARIDVFRVYANEVEAICTLLKKKPHEISVLDFGMGWGFWTFVAQAMNIDVKGAELSKKRITYAKSRGIRVVEDIYKEKSNSYDCIYSDQVFEHLTNPSELLKELTRLLKKGGIIRIKVPNGGRIEKKILKKTWQAKKDALHPLEHINCFTRNSLKNLGKELGLQVIDAPNLQAKNGGSLLRGFAKQIYERTYSTEIYFKK